MTIRTILVDDEPLATQGLQLRLQAFDDVEIVASAANGREAIRQIKTHKPDLVFLDIQMPGFDGFSVIQGLMDVEPPLFVFVTAYGEHALRAFDAQAVDYLMKPVEPRRLQRALDRARTYLRQRTGQPQPGKSSQWLDEFWASDLSGLVRIASQDVDRVSAERDYMRLHVGRRSWLIHHSMTALEEGLNPDLFVRLHRSAIVRKDFIAGFTRNQSGRWIARLADGTEQPVGRLYSDRVRAIAGR